MKIDDRMLQYEIGKHLPKSPVGETEKPVEKQVPDGSVSKESSPPGGGDTIVHLSDTSREATREAQRIKDIIAAAPDVREDRVAELKAKIDSGNYRMDADAVADKLVDAFFEDLT